MAHRVVPGASRLDQVQVTNSVLTAVVTIEPLLPVVTVQV